MAAVNNHKLALLYMMRELLQNTDEDHPLNASELIEILSGYGMEADRRTIYSNVETLREFGLDVIKKEDGHIGYYIGEREFELPELKLLADAVSSSKFITEKKSEQLIRKLMGQTNAQKMKELNRQVFIRNRMKTENEKIFYSVDTLHEAMNRDRRIRFRYGEYRIDKTLAPRRGGEYYHASPWALTWSDENYYLIAFDEEDRRIKHFRVDKMMDVSIEEGSVRSGKDQFGDFDLPAFSRKTFGMYGGRDADVSMRCPSELAGVIIDRFGREVTLIPDGDRHFRVRVTVSVSPQFFGWITGIGEGLEIISPPGIREEYQHYLKGILRQYGDAEQ